jgi:hypothetical protein
MFVFLPYTKQALSAGREAKSGLVMFDFLDKLYSRHGVRGTAMLDLRSVAKRLRKFLDVRKQHAYQPDIGLRVFLNSFPNGKEQRMNGVL